MIKHFLLRLFLFSLPVILTGLFLFFIIFIFRENFVSPDRFVGKNNYQLVGYAYNEDNYKYIKWNELYSRNGCDVVCLGSSRIGEFRDSMFNATFYNAAFSVKKVNELKPFLAYLPKNKLPRVLILCLDQWMFNASFNVEGLSEIKENVWRESFSFWPQPEVFKQTAKSLLEGKIGFDDLKQAMNQRSLNKIGFQAIVNEQGFRIDGSKCKSNLIERIMNQDSTLEDFQFRDTYSRIDMGVNRFEYGAIIDSNALIILNDFFGFCASNRIKVVAYLPPFSEAVLNKMLKSGKYRYLNDLPSCLNALCKEKQVEFWDFTQLSQFGSSDAEVIDGFHGGQVAYLRMLLYMVHHGSVLNRYTNAEKLELDLHNRQNPYLVYRDQFN